MEKLRHYMAARGFIAGRSDLIEAGFSPTRIKNWHQGDRLVQVIRGVYSLGRDIEAREAALRAALAAAGPGSALTGQSACEQWGLIKRGQGIPRYVEVATKRGNSRRLRGSSPAMVNTEVRVVKRTLGSGDLRERDGIVLTRPALALIDFSARASEREVRFAFLEACRLKLFNERDLKFCFRRLVGRRGARKLRPFLALWVPELARIRSVLEGWFLIEWVERGFPVPQVNAKVAGFEVDMYWPEQGVVLELDGGAFHRGTVQQRIDLEKQLALEALGLIVIRATYREFEENPDAVVERVATALRLRAAA